MNETTRQKKGRLGENAAAEHLIQNGYRVVAQNVHVSHDEIDLIVEDDEYLVFVEVKTRTQDYGVRSKYGRPADAVNRTKKSRTVRAAQGYLRTHPTCKQPRIDVVEVYISKVVGQEPTVERVVWFRNAVWAR